MSKKKYYGSLFEAARTHLNMTQVEMAEELGCSQSALSKLESDRLEPSAGDIVWLTSKLLKCDILAEFEVIIAPARLKIEQRWLRYDHDKKLHMAKPHEKCPKCIGRIESQRISEEMGRKKQAELAAKMPVRLHRRASA